MPKHCSVSLLCAQDTRIPLLAGLTFRLDHAPFVPDHYVAYVENIREGHPLYGLTAEDVGELLTQNGIFPPAAITHGALIRNTGSWRLGWDGPIHLNREPLVETVSRQVLQALNDLVQILLHPPVDIYTLDPDDLMPCLGGPDAV